MTTTNSNRIKDNQSPEMGRPRDTNVRTLPQLQPRPKSMPLTTVVSDIAQVHARPEPTSPPAADADNNNDHYKQQQPVAVLPLPPTASEAPSRPRPRSMKKCTVPLCESYARSRGLCKAHGGGKRCKRPGCSLSDQGGGMCIRHGGGKRCQVEGCTKSAQSRRFCKAHGGGARCKVEGCEKSSQGGGLCRTHGGGPRRRKLVNANGEPLVPTPTPTTPSSSTWSRGPLAHLTAVATASTMPIGNASDSRIECARGTGALAFKIRPVDAAVEPLAPMNLLLAIHRECEAKDATSTNGDSLEQTQPAQGTNPTALGCRVGGCEKPITQRERELCDEHRTHLFVAASLLGMQAAPN